MKRVFFKVLSLMLIVIMLTTSIPLNSLAANDANGVINNSTVEIKDTNSFSKILADDVDMSKSTVDMPYYISKIEFNDNVATVEYYNQSTCRLLVVIYDENTEEMITSEVAEIGEESLETKITFEDSYPENFLAKGFLIDYDNAALCPAFVCRTYTTEFKEIQEKTVYDFDSEKVISFDNTDDNNFAVLSDEAIVINGSDERNTLVSADVDNNIYKIKNIDDSVKNLQSGDVVYFDNDDLLNLVTIKIKSITVNGTEATIVAEDSEMEDIFDFVKIDSSTSAGEGEYSAEGADEDVEYLGDVSYETGEAEISTQAVSGGSDFTPSKKWKIAEKEVKNKNGKANALFSATLIFGVNIVFSYYLSRNFKEVSFVASPFIKVSASASGTIETLSIKLGSLSFTPITGIFIGFEPRFTVKFSGELSFSGELNFAIGLGFNSRDGFANKCQAPHLITELKSAVRVFIGFDLRPYMAVLSKHAAKITMSGEVGVEAIAQMSKNSDTAADPANVDHSCKQCIAGEINALMTIGVKVSFGEDTWIEKSYESTIFRLKVKITDFYYSFTYNEFGFTGCPHIFKEFTVTVFDSDKKRVWVAKVLIDNETQFTEENGVAKFKMNLGKHLLKASKEDYATFAMNITVKPDSQNFLCPLFKKSTNKPGGETGGNKPGGETGGSTSDGTGSNDSVFTGTEATGTIINFGSYPQSEVKNEATIKRLDKITKNWISYEYYSGTGNEYDGNMKPSDYMKYADFEYGGNKYRAVTFSEYRPIATHYVAANTFINSHDEQWRNGYCNYNTYYFKYEPLRWRVLDAKTGLIVCDSAIDSQAYNNYIISADEPIDEYGTYEYYGDSNKTYYANNWEHSSIRKWLNNEFYDTAFSTSQQGKIQQLTRKNKCSIQGNYFCGPTSEKVTLLSYDDIYNANYGFATDWYENDMAKCRKCTDYAKCQGIFDFYFENWCSWWLRTPATLDSQAYISDYEYNNNEFGSGNCLQSDVNLTIYGVVPALNLTPSTISTASILDGEIFADEMTGETELFTADEFTLDGAVDGNCYMIYGIKDYSDKLLVSSENLVYADQSVAENKTVTLPYRAEEENNVTVIAVGDFGNGTETKILSPQEIKASVNSVSISDVTLNYKKSTTIKPTIKADDGAKYTVEYSSSNTKVATVDNNGKVYGAKKGSATITCTVTDSNGNVATDTCKVTVGYSFGQWLIVIVLFGWIWY